MSPPSSSKPSAQRPGASSRSADRAHGKDEGKLDVRADQSDRQSLSRSPSGISLSRPRSLLAPSRPSPSTPIVHATDAPSNVLSASPSSRSTVDRSMVTGGFGSTLRAGESSAMGRLRRVASNASISSSLRVFSKPVVNTAAEPDEQHESTSSTTGSANIDRHEQDSQSQQAQKKPTESNVKQDVAMQTEERSPASAKRHLENGQSADPESKQARRRTWFGFWSEDPGQNAENAADSTSTEAQAGGESHDTSMHDAEAGEDDGQSTMKGTIRPIGIQNSEHRGTVKSWLPWRAPDGEGEGTADTADTAAIPGPHEAPGSYVDSVRRYMSWGAQQASAVSPPSASWGWPAWRSASVPAEPSHSHLESNSVAKQADSPSHDTPDLASANAKDAQMLQKISLEGVQSSPIASSPAQASFMSRWMPTWGRSSPQVGGSEDGNDAIDGSENTEIRSAQIQPTTPAEQYKAEALAHLGAKDAILNSATRSSWINYFGSRSAATRTKLNDSDPDEPEIMRINGGKPVDDNEANNGAQPQKKQSDVAASLSVPPRSGASTPAETRSLASGRRSDAKEKAIADPASTKSRPVTPLTRDKETAQRVVAAAGRAPAQERRAASAPGKKGAVNQPNGPAAPNLLLPSFDDTFSTQPRSISLKTGVWEKTMSLFFNTSSQKAKQPDAPSSSLNRAQTSASQLSASETQSRLPRSWTAVGDKERANARGCKEIRKVTVIGLHGWFSQGPIRNLFGEPTGTSAKFASMMTDSVKKHFDDAGFALSEDQITSIPLIGDGLVSDRVDKSFSALIGNAKWIEALQTSDAVFVAAHSQGSVVATHLLARLVEQRHLDPRKTRVVLLCMCGIHNGPFAHLRGSISSYYLNTFETPAAKELFEFQNGHSPVSRLYAASLRIVCAAGIKLVYVASLDDQVVPLFSALHTSATHPSILRAIFCDGAAFPRVDFLTNLLSFCIGVRNAGLWDHHLVTLLSSSVAGSLYGGLGHSLVYEEPQVYGLAVRYLLEVTSPAGYPTARPGQADAQRDSSTASSVAHFANLPVGVPALELDEDFTLARNQKWNSNPYALPWSLRGLLEDERVRHFFSPQIDKLIQDYLDWQPSTKTLKDVQFRLEPMRLIAGSPQQRASTSSTRAPSSTSTSALNGKTSNSKL